MIKIINYIKLPIFALITLAFIYGGINLVQAKNEINTIKNTKTNIVSIAETPKIEETKPIETIKYIPVDNEIGTQETQSIDETPAPVIVEKVFTPSPAKTVKKSSAKTVTTTPTSSASPLVTPTIEIKESTVKIENVGTYKVEISSNDTAFLILKRAASQNGFSISYDTYDFGVFVTSINGIKANDAQFWAFYYNGAFSNVGASDQKVSQDDVISWKLQSF